MWKMFVPVGDEAVDWELFSLLPADWVAVQHPAATHTVQLAQAFLQNAQDDVVRHCQNTEDYQYSHSIR